MAQPGSYCNQEAAHMAVKSPAIFVSTRVIVKMQEFA
jgi:hypothetical protein